MWTLTITHGEYHDPKTLVHRSKNEHDWTQEGAYWHFTANDDDGQIDWTALVANIQLAVDVKQLDEPATAQSQDQDQDQDQATTAPGEDPVSGWV